MYVYTGISFMNCFSFSKPVLVCPKGLAYPQEIRRNAILEHVAYAKTHAQNPLYPWIMVPYFLLKEGGMKGNPPPSLLTGIFSESCNSVVLVPKVVFLCILQLKWDFLSDFRYEPFKMHIYH